jgi:hypothetical protein
VSGGRSSDDDSDSATTDVVAIDSFGRIATTSCRGNRFNHPSLRKG